MSDTICVVPIPGPAGAAGADGADGTNGVSAFTTTTASFVMPAELGTTPAPYVAVVTSAPFDVGQIVYVEVGGAKGYFEVISKPSATTLELKNLEDTATSAYLINSAPTTPFASGASVQPGGLQGPAGTAGVSGAPTDATYITQTLNGTLSAEQPLNALAAGSIMRTHAGGTGAVIAAVDGTDYLSPSTGLEPGDIGVSVQAFDAGLTSLAALPTVADRYAYSTALNVWVEGTITAAGRALLDDASATVQRSTLGLQRATQDILIYQHQLAAGTNAGTFTSGSWATVPLNTEVADTGSHGSIASNTVTLATGVYRVRWRMCGYQVGLFQSRIFNVTTAGTVALGSNAKSAAADAVQTESHGEGRITIAAATEDIRIEAQCETTNADDGFGIANAFGGTQVYAALWLEKEVG